MVFLSLCRLYLFPILASFTSRRLYMLLTVFLLGPVLVNLLAVLVCLGPALHLLHLGALVLEPDLDHAHGQPRVLSQRLTHLKILVKG